jgi:geranylgeranyl transferase type-2 subunit beta
MPAAGGARRAARLSLSLSRRSFVFPLSSFALSLPPMAEATYLEDLHLRLALGIARLPENVLAPTQRFLIAAQRPDGGFAGREGDSDLYYTGFGLRGLAVAGAITPAVCEAAARFVRARLGQPAGAIDVVSLLYAALLVRACGGPDVLAESSPDWADRIAGALERHRSPDGGYAKTAGGAMGSTYHTFLVALAPEMIGRPLPAPERVTEFLRSRRREDGGFVELAVMKRSGANPTAAAVALARMLGDDGGLTGGAADCLLALQSPSEGGFCANRSMPVADLLSTFTALLTLRDLGAFGRVDSEAARTFALSLAAPAGGFRAGVWDDQPDVEYTFYGLGSLALLEEVTE